jgi:hypothetical protein
LKGLVVSDFFVAAYLVYGRTWMLAMFYSWICKFCYTLVLCWLLRVAGGDVDDALG